MKTMTLALAFCAATTMTATAGGMSEPVMDSDIVIQQTQSASSSATNLPVILFAILVAAAVAG